MKDHSATRRESLLIWLVVGLVMVLTVQGWRWMNREDMRRVMKEPQEKDSFYFGTNVLITQDGLPFTGLVVDGKIKPTLTARNVKPSPKVRSELSQKIWNNMTDRDREEHDAIEAAFEEGMVTRDFAEWRRLLEVRGSRPPWEHETRQEQEWRLARGITNFTVIEITNRTEKPLFVPGDRPLNSPRRDGSPNAQKLE